MKPKYLAELSEQELLQQIRDLKTNKIADATIIGVIVGIAIYSAVKNGLGFFTFFPLILGYIIIRNSRNNEIFKIEIQKELESRNSQ